MTRVILTARMGDEMGGHALGAYPLEACGLLIGRRTPEEARITRALRCPNVADRSVQTHRFEIDPRVILNVRRSLRGTGESILGFYHSHPDAAAAPSASDLRYLRLWPETVWMIVPVVAGVAGAPRAWWLDGVDAPAPRELGLEIRAAGPVRLLACPE